MEPLSAVASAIALTQAAEKLLKAAKLAKSVGEIPNEYLMLLEELEFVKALAKNVDDHVQSHDATDVGLLRSVSQRLSSSATGLQEMSEAVERSSRLSRGKATQGHTKVSTVRWQMNKSDIAMIKQNISLAKEDLTICLQLLISRQMTFSLQSSQEAQQVLLDLKGDIADRSAPELVDFTSSIEQGPAISRDLCGIRSIPKPTKHGPLPDPGEVGPYCDLLCRCKCHDMPATKPFLWVEYLLGSLTINKNFNLFSKEPCDVPTCKLPSPLLAKVRYTSPSWTVRRAVEASMAWDALGGAGVNLHLRVPRVASYLPFFLISTGDIVVLKRELSSGRIMPADVSPSGGSLLEFALWPRGSSDQNAQIARLLWDFGCDPTLSTPEHPSAITRAREALRAGWYEDGSEWTTVLQMIAYGNTLAKNEPIRVDGLLRAFFTGDDERLETILNHCKEHLNLLDECGWGVVHYAVANNRTRALESLLRHGADPHLQTSEGTPPLVLAAARTVGVEASEILLRYGAKADSADNGMGKDIICTPIMRTLGQPAKMRLLLNHGACASNQHAMLETPFHNPEPPGLVSYNEQDAGRAEACIEETIRILEAQGIGIDYPDSRGSTPLMIATTKLDTFTMRVLVRLGARIDVQDNRGHTVLHEAAMTRDRAVFNVLKTAELSSIVDKRDDEGYLARDYVGIDALHWRDLLTSKELDTFFDELWSVRVAKFLPGPNCFS